jgi:hypothetical protein
VSLSFMRVSMRAVPSYALRLTRYWVTQNVMRKTQAIQPPCESK